MNKKKSLVLVLFMVVVLVLTTCMLVACNAAEDTVEETSETVEIEATEGLTISNSDFKVVSSLETYPTTVTDWTGAKSYTSGSYADDVISGVINLAKEKYDANKATWSDDSDVLYNKLVAGNRYGDTDEIKNALLIYMPKAIAEEDATDDDPDYGPTAYGYTSSSFSLDKASYYKLSIDVLTMDIAGNTDMTRQEPGARIYVSSNTYAEFSQINTNGEWATYTIYVESAKTASTSLTLSLSLGKYTSSYTYGLTTGYVVFDNLTLEKVEEAEYATAVNNELTDNSKLQTTTLTVPNGRFDYGTTTLGTTSAPSNWSVVTGNSSEDDAAPTSKGYNAIIDASKFADNYSDYSSTYYLKRTAEAASEGMVFANNLEAIKDSVPQLLDGTVGSNVYMLSQQVMTAQGLKSSKTITIEKKKIYELSINLYTYSIHGAGVSLILSGSDTKDIVLSGISNNNSSNFYIGNYTINKDTSLLEIADNGTTTGGWVTYKFYIVGNQFYNCSYNMTIWLGTEGTNSNTKVEYTKYSSSSESSDTSYDASGTFSNGWVFMDDVKLKAINEVPQADASIEYIAAGAETKYNIGSSSKTAIAVDLSVENLFATGGNTFTDSYVTTDLAEGAAAITTIGNPENWANTYDYSDVTAPAIDGLITTGLVNLENEGTFNASFANGQALSAYPNMPYAIANTNALLINAKEDSFYQMSSEAITINKSQTYRLSVWAKTVDVKSTSGLYVTLYDGEDSLSSISQINTDEYDETTNDWVELVFYILGDNEENKDLTLTFALGSGTRWSASTLTSGSVYIANLNLLEVSYKSFSNVSTSTYVKSVDLSESYTYTFTNGSFDSIDKDADDYDASKPLSENTVVGEAESWSISDETKKDDNLIAGVIALERDGGSTLYFSKSAQTDALFGTIIDFDTVYGDKTDNATYLASEHLKTVAGPNMLAIASKDATTEYAIGFSSSSFTLSSNTTYKLVIYARTYANTTASIYLKGESSGNIVDNYFTLASDTDWTAYTYYIQVGQTSVSPQLNLWLGTDSNYVTEVKSAGAVLFDNIILTSIDDEDIPTAPTANEKKISFMVDGFDSLSSSISSRSSLSTPSSWSGAVDTNQTSSNTKSGVIYASGSYLEDTDGYINILGGTYTKDSYEVSSEEIDEAKQDAEYAGKTDEEILDLLKEKKYNADRQANLVTLSDLTPHSGNQMLVINNTTESAYVYTSSSTTLSAETCYRISLYVKTLKLNDGDEKGAYIQLYLGDAEEDDNPMIFKAVRADDWTKYEFYVKTLDDSVSSVTIKLALGKYYEQEDDEAEIPSLTSGYAFFDDVAVEKIEEADFDAATENAALLKRTVEIAEKGEADDDEDDGETEEPTSTFNLEYLWWMIPTIILGLLTIVVVVVWIIKKVKAKQPKKESYVDESEKVSTETIDQIRSKYDSNKE